jgi:hypothetical protein
VQLALPVPTGPYPVGTVPLHLVDGSRPDCLSSCSRTARTTTVPTPPSWFRNSPAILSLEHAVLHGSGDAAASALRLADVARGGLDDSEWSTSVAFSGRHLTARELVLLPAQPPGGLVDLRHATVGLLRDAPATWPPGLRVDGLSYNALTDVDGRDARLRWLRLDPRGCRPQPYAHLAQVYRAAGRDEDARTVLLAGERHRRDTLSLPGRWWGHLQDLTVGYGYRPVRAGGWLVMLFAVGTAVFTLHPPQAADPSKAPCRT